MNVKANELGDQAGNSAGPSALARSAGVAWQHKWSVLGIVLVLAAAAIGAA